jgi:hypothetical protein
VAALRRGAFGLAQRTGSVRLTGPRRDLQAGKDALGLRVRADRLEQPTGLVGVAPARRDLGESQPGAGMRSVGLPRLLEEGLRLGLAAGGELLEPLHREAIRLGRKDRVEELADGRLRDGADELGGELPVDEGLHGRDALDAEGHRRLGVRIHVELSEQERPVVLVGQPLENGADHPAGGAPFRPEVHDDGAALGFLDDRLHEVLVGHLDDVRAGHGHQGSNDGMPVGVPS